MSECRGPGIVHAPPPSRLTGTRNGTEPSLIELVSPVLLLLSQVNMSAVKQDNTPGPRGPPAFSVSSNTPDSNVQLFIKLCWSLIMTHSFEWEVLRQGNIQKHAGQMETGLQVTRDLYCLHLDFYGGFGTYGVGYRKEWFLCAAKWLVCMHIDLNDEADSDVCTHTCSQTCNNLLLFWRAHVLQAPLSQCKISRACKTDPDPLNEWF